MIAHLCYCCGQLKDPGETMIGGLWRCDDCKRETKSLDVRTAGKILADGVKKVNEVKA